MHDSSDEAYVQHLRSEHRRLHRLMRQTLAALPQWEDASEGNWAPVMLRGLKAIREELAAHFRIEEAGGCLEEAVSRCPSLAPQAAQVLQEHRSLLADLDQLIQRVTALRQPTAAAAHALSDELHAVLRRLNHHERLENRIVQQAFGLSVEDEESWQPPVDQAP
jgi:hemerythrin-like domain-containing protein